MKDENDFCAGCDHKIVPGVACDGMTLDCPYHPQAKRHPSAMTRYASAQDSFSGKLDFDAVRSDC